MNEIITVFCSVSEKEIFEVEKLLIPSLLHQNVKVSIDLVLINWTGVGRVYNGPKEVGKIKITEINAEKKLGFGAAHNYAFNAIKPSKCFIVANPGYFQSDCIENLSSAKKNNKNWGIIEAKQLPFSHPKGVGSELVTTPWASGACMLVNSEFFEKIGGFDENFWMYLEDVDLSWRAWLAGYKVMFQPTARFYHFTGTYFAYRPDRLYLENFWSLRNFIYLMHKYWGLPGEMYAKYLISKTNYSKSFKKELVKSYTDIKGKKFIGLKKSIKAIANPMIKVRGVSMFHDLGEK